MTKIKKKTLTGAELKQSKAWWKKQDKKRALQLKKQKAWWAKQDKLEKARKKKDKKWWKEHGR